MVMAILFYAILAEIFSLLRRFFRKDQPVKDILSERPAKQANGHCFEGIKSFPLKMQKIQDGYRKETEHEL